MFFQIKLSSIGDRRECISASAASQYLHGAQAPRPTSFWKHFFIPWLPQAGGSRYPTNLLLLSGITPASKLEVESSRKTLDHGPSPWLLRVPGRF